VVSQLPLQLSLLVRAGFVANIGILDLGFGVFGS
jgi:hypothetical protein